MHAERKTVKDYIRTIVDFPHEGIMFRDVTTLFADTRGFRMAVDQLLHGYAYRCATAPYGDDKVGFEAAFNHLQAKCKRIS